MIFTVAKSGLVVEIDRDYGISTQTTGSVLQLSEGSHANLLQPALVAFAPGCVVSKAKLHSGVAEDYAQIPTYRPPIHPRPSGQNHEPILD